MLRVVAGCKIIKIFTRYKTVSLGGIVEEIDLKVLTKVDFLGFQIVDVLWVLGAVCICNSGYNLFTHHLRAVRISALVLGADVEVGTLGILLLIAWRLVQNVILQ